MSDEAVHHWKWLQLELVGVQHVDGELLIDAIEVTHHADDGADPLLTLALVPSNASNADLDGLSETMQRWVASDAVCEVIRTDHPDNGTLALFQDGQLLFFATA